MTVQHSIVSFNRRQVTNCIGQYEAPLRRFSSTGATSIATTAANSLAAMSVHQESSCSCLVLLSAPLFPHQYVSW